MQRLVSVEAKTGHCGEAKTAHCGEAKTAHCGEAQHRMLSSHETSFPLR